MKLSNQVAIVTGAAGAGIGAGVATALARQGANVVVSDAHPKRPVEVAESIKKDIGVDALGIQCDVSNREQVDNLVKQALERWGKVDILVNNAGINRLAKLVDVTDEIWDLVINVNLRGTFHCTRAILPSMIKQKYGKIVNISSSVVFIGSTDGEAPYLAAKAGIIGFTRAVAKEVAEYGIAVNCIAPGVIMNPFLERIYTKEAMERTAAQIPMGTGKPDDIAGVVEFLVTDQGRYVTGQTISVSGGWVMH